MEKSASIVVCLVLVSGSTIYAGNSLADIALTAATGISAGLTTICVAKAIENISMDPITSGVLGINSVAALICTASLIRDIKHNFCTLKTAPLHGTIGTISMIGTVWLLN